MKTNDKSTTVKSNLDDFISGVSEVKILDLHAMISVRGGDGEGNGGEPIIIIPPKQS